jgi:hypothetical protein
VVRHLSKAAQRSYESQMAEMDDNSDNELGDRTDDRDRDDDVSFLWRTSRLQVRHPMLLFHHDSALCGCFAGRR